MSFTLSIFKSLLTVEIKEKINVEINTIQDSNNWQNISKRVSVQNFEKPDLDHVEFLRKKNVWEDLAKLSLNLWNDYEYYKQFTFRAKYDDADYVSQLVNLGYECKDGEWESLKKPNLLDVQLNIFMYCMYMSMCNDIYVKEVILQNNENELRQQLVFQDVKACGNNVEENIDIQPLQYLPSADDQIILKDLTCETISPKDKRKIERVEDQSIIKCQYCDTDNNIGDIKCNVCEADLLEDDEAGIKYKEGFVNVSNRKNRIINNEENKGNYNKHISPFEDVPPESSKYSENNLIHPSSSSNGEGFDHRLKKKEFNDSNENNNKIDNESDCNNDMKKKDEDVELREKYLIKGKGDKENEVDNDYKSSLKYDNAPSEIIMNNNNNRHREDTAILAGGSWSCTSCTFINKSNVHTCETCFCDKIEDKPTEIDKVNKEDHHINKNSSRRNNSSNKKKSEETKVNVKKDVYDIENVSIKDKNIENVSKRRVDNLVEPTKGWSCTTCTFFNISTNTKCETCNEDKNKENKVKQENELKITPKNKNNNEIRNDKYSDIDNKREIVKERSDGRQYHSMIESSSSKFGKPVSKDQDKDYNDIEMNNFITKTDVIVKEQSKYTWSCPSCTFNNKLEYKCCELCFTFPEVEEKEIIEEDVEKGDNEEVVEVIKEVWKCKDCKEDNLYDRYTCGKCRQYAPFFVKWRCERCSFFNNEMSQFCEVCENKNVHVKMCNKCKKTLIKVSGGAECDNCKNRSSVAQRTSTERNIEDVNVPEDIDNSECNWEFVIIKKNKKQKEYNYAKEDIAKKLVDNKYFCNNVWCGMINNNKNKHCSKCKIKKGANITFYNKVDVYNGEIYIKMWQCTFCGVLNTKGSCKICKNIQHCAAYKKCSQCNWVNINIRKKCDKCFKILSSK